MDPKVILAGLEEIARRVGLEIRYEKLEDDEFRMQSGHYRLGNHRVILVEKRLDTNGRIQVLRRELAAVNLDGVFMKPFFRSMLVSEESENE
jgi:hypothetical protein